MFNEGGYQHMTNMGDGSSLMHFGFHGVFALLIIGLLIYGVVLIVRHLSKGQCNDPALNALGTRYANGEIEREEYLEKKKDIQG